MLKEGQLDDREVEVDVTPQAFPMLEIMQPPQGMEGQDINFMEMLQEMMPKRKKRRTVRLPEARRILARSEDLRDIISMLGIDELAPEDRLVVGRARRLRNFLTQPFFVTQTFTNLPGRRVAIADTVDGVAAIAEGRCDDVAEDELFMIGELSEAVHG